VAKETLSLCGCRRGTISVLVIKISLRITKLFTTNVTESVKVCQDYFDFDLCSITIEKRKKTFFAPIDRLGYINVH